MATVAACGRGMSRERRPAVLSVILPCYNEAPTLAEVLARIRAAPLAGLGKEIVVVDDGSTDGSGELLRGALACCVDQLVIHRRNRGKGAAIRSGVEVATGDLVVVQDGDLEYDPAQYDRLAAPLIDGSADVVYGSRMSSWRPTGVRTAAYRAANAALTRLSNLFSGLTLTDMETCHKMFARRVLESVDIRENRFGFEPEVTAKVARGGWRVREIDIPYAPRSRAEGKKIGWRDGLRAVYCIVRYNVFG